MTVDLDAQEGAVALPVQLGVRDVEQVTGTDNLLAGHAHQTDLGRVAADFRSPVAEELLVVLDALTVRRGGAPLKVLNLLNLDRDLVEQVHARQLVDRDSLLRSHTGHVLGVGRPLERGPLKLLLDGVAGLVGLGASGVESDEGTQRHARLDVPDDVVLAVLIERQHGVALIDLHGAVRPGGKVLLVGREVDEVDARVGETLLSAPRLCTPQLNTLGVHRRQVGTLGRPLHERLGPVLAVDNRVGLLVPLVPEDADTVAAVHDKLVAAVVVAQPPAQVLLLLELVHLRRVVLLLDAALTAEALDVGKLVDSHSVLLVQWGTVQRLDGSLGLCGRLVFDKGVSLGHLVVVAEGHQDVVLACLADGGELAKDELDELSLALLGHLGKAIYHDKRVEALLHAHVELLAQIC